ncbi:MAG: hypothetical protein IPJ51_01210 [Saprospiraceae bacterium]|nr:hypothetical protein [Saprospiraceae bacterium]
MYKVFRYIKTFTFVILAYIVNAQCPTVEAIMVDACGTEQDNEFVIINAGGGFNSRLY